jgi:hypothetical protein
MIKLNNSMMTADEVENIVKLVESKAGKKSVQRIHCLVKESREIRVFGQSQKRAAAE